MQFHKKNHCSGRHFEKFFNHSRFWCHRINPLILDLILSTFTFFFEIHPVSLPFFSSLCKLHPSPSHFLYMGIFKPLAIWNLTHVNRANFPTRSRCNSTPSDRLLRYRTITRGWSEGGGDCCGIIINHHARTYSTIRKLEINFDPLSTLVQFDVPQQSVASTTST